MSFYNLFQSIIQNNSTKPIIIIIAKNRSRCWGRRTGTSCTCSTCGSAGSCCSRSSCSGLINTRSVRKNGSSYLFQKFVIIWHVVLYGIKII